MVPPKRLTRPFAFPNPSGTTPDLPQGQTMYATRDVMSPNGTCSCISCLLTREYRLALTGPYVLESLVRYAESPSTQQCPGGIRTGVGGEGGSGWT